MSDPVAGARPRRLRWPAWLGLVVLAAASVVSGLNAWRYTEATANPVVTDDAWYFLDVFTSRQLDGRLAWQDFFAKRDASDHAQPVHKLWLAANTRWLDLDFRLDALVAFGGLVVCVAWLVAVGWTGARAGEPRLHHGVLLAAIPLLMFSLNAHEIFEWPLVTQYYLVLPFALLLFTVASRSTATWPLGVFVSALGGLLALDGGGLLACLAASSALLLRAASTRRWRAALPLLGALVAAVAVNGVLRALFLPPPPAPPGGGLLEALGALPTDPAQAWKLVAIPATSAWAHWDSLVELLESPLAAQRVVVAVGGVSVLLHALFWWSVWRGVRSGVVSSFAAMLMLYAYGMWAGIALGRIPVHGVDYLWQMRYIAFFQLANVALILQWVAATSARAGATGVAGRALPALVVVPLVCALGWLQVQFSERSWERSPHARQYWMRMADVVGCIADHPVGGELRCPPQIPICGWSPQTRQRLVAMLRTHQLNVFAPSLQARYGFRPDDAPAELCLGDAGP
jgi:hypothetical protein